jgi:hypothetical protein
MKVFISWSGSLSRTIAETLYEWMKTLLPEELDPWMSKKNVELGSQWARVLFEELRTTDYGIICLTPDNVDSDWMLFEAGALAKTFGEDDMGRVIPLLYDVERDKLPSPYIQFQSAPLNEDAILHLFLQINAGLQNPVAEERLTRIFRSVWPEIEKKLDTGVTKLLSEHPEQAYEFYARRYGVGHAEVSFQGTLREDGMLTIRRQVTVEAFWETKTLDTFLTFHEGTNHNRDSDLARADVVSLEAGRHVETRVRDAERNRLAADLVFDPPLKPEERTSYLMTERSIEPIYDLSDGAEERTKYFGWSVYRPTRLLTITVTLPESLEPHKPRVEVMRASTFGFSGERVEEAESSRLQESLHLRQRNGGEWILTLTVDFPVHGFIYKVAWDLE